jgi:very-short-patch-repair endonuclease
MTPAEEWLWEALRGGRLDGLKFRRQQVIGGYIADFYCDAAGLVIEVDGPVHDTQAGLDQAREEAINLHGLRVLRFPNDRVLNQLPDVLAAIASTARTEGEHHDQHPQS